MPSSKRLGLLIAGAAGVVAAVTVTVGAVWGGGSPDDWPRKAEFCEAAAALEVGATERSHAEHVEVLEALAENAPEELDETFDAIVHASEHGDPGMVEEDQAREVGEFIEETCGLNMPGVST